MLEIDAQRPVGLFLAAAIAMPLLVSRNCEPTKSIAWAPYDRTWRLDRFGYSVPHVGLVLSHCDCVVSVKVWEGPVRLFRDAAESVTSQASTVANEGMMPNMRQIDRREWWL
jgi:hypothetical protein